WWFRAKVAHAKRHESFRALKSRWQNRSLFFQPERRVSERYVPSADAPRNAGKIVFGWFY
ncbi:MAG: hypothetical protein NWQ46_06155, partial [Spirosomaceae bacterium]|nr:hypothetical protein [Spirosomataceae bacterium]